MKYTTILRVTLNDKRHKVWKIVRHDEDPSLVGMVREVSLRSLTACGVPARAQDVPIGSEYISVLQIPEFIIPNDVVRCLKCGCLDGLHNNNCSDWEYN
jgi:hypothetical protein